MCVEPFHNIPEIYIYVRRDSKTEHKNREYRRTYSFFYYFNNNPNRIKKKQILDLHVLPATKYYTTVQQFIGIIIRTWWWFHVAETWYN